MRVTIFPSKASGSAQVPPSKSVALRALICGALSESSTIHNIVYSEDVETMLRCLKEMGATVCKQKGSVTIGEMNPFWYPEEQEPILHCDNSGSTFRYLLPLCLLGDLPTVFVGSSRLINRPMVAYRDFCRQYGLTWLHNEYSVVVRGPLYANRFALSDAMSSPFISGLMMAMPLLIEESHIDLESTSEMLSYVKLTSAVQEAFGVTTVLDGEHITLCPGGVYHSTEFTVEGDCALAAAIDAFNLIGESVKVLGLSEESAQIYSDYKALFRQFGDDNCEFDLSECRDLLPVLFALTAICGGGTFRITRPLKVKDEYRIKAMMEELEKFGVPITCGENTIEIAGCSLREPSQTLSGHKDPFLVMALGLLCSRVGGTIEGAEAVKQIYADYFDVLQSLSIDLRVEEE